jgi:iron complex outermembrane recepter protein
MTLHKRILIGSVSGMAIASAVAIAPVLAADSSTQVQEVVITGIRQSLQKAIQVKRNNDDQIDAISATDIGKLPDKNIADALQRLPGVNTTSSGGGEGGFDENDRVSIRGTSPSLTQVTIDGHNVSTGDWFILEQFQAVGRSVSFELLPSEIVQGVNVYKTQDASLLEGGVAGSVDIETRDPLKLAQPITFEGSVQGAYNSISKQTKPQLNGLLGWKSPDGNLGVIIQGFAEDRSSERFGQETLGYTPITSAMPIAAGHPELIGVQAPTLIGSTLFEQEKKRDGGYAAIAWSPNSNVELNLSGFYSNLKATNLNYNYMYWGNNELNNNTPTSYTVSNNTLTSAVWPGNGVDGIIDDNITRPGASSQSYYINFDGKFRVNDNLSFKTQVGFTHGLGQTLDAPSFEVLGDTAGISYRPSGNGWLVTPGTNAPGTPNGYFGPQSSSGLNAGWVWNERFISVDKETYAKVDGQWDLHDGAIKSVDFGARVANHSRQTDGWDRGCSLGANSICNGTNPGMPFSVSNPTPYPGGFNGGALGIPGLLIPLGSNPNSVNNILNGVNDPLRGNVSKIVQPLNYYWPGTFKVTELDTEAYAMAHVGGDGWRGNFGVRIANTRETPNANVSDPSGLHAGDIKSSAFGPYYVTNKVYNYLDILPSVNLTFDLKKNLLLRMSASETMSRPDFTALGGTVSLTDTTNTGSGGNPSLKPVKAAVYDVALEWYYAPTSVAAVSLFHDDLSSYVTYTVNSQVYFSQLHNDFETYRISSPSNTSGELSGAEIQIQQPLKYGFGFQFNATYVDGQEADGAPLTGTSRLTYNAVAYYEDHGLSARLAYTYRSHFLIGLDRATAENQQDYGTLDASLNYSVTKNVDLTLDALNITNSLLKYYAYNTTQPRAVYENGTQVFAGFKLKF